MSGTEDGRSRESPLAPVPMAALRSARPPDASRIELDPPMPIISLSKLGFELLDHIFFPSPAMICIECQVVVARVPVSPKLDSLDCPQTADVAIRIGPPMRIRPCDINVKPINQIFTPEIPLELHRAVDRCKLVLHFDVLIVHKPICLRIPNPMWLSEGKVQFHFTGVSESSVL